MSFQQAVAATPGLAAAYRRGLQAVRAPDRQRLTATKPRRLRGSVDLDDALRHAYPNVNRWDYGIGARGAGGDVVYWAEVHPATDGQIGVMMAKLDWLKTWLTTSNTMLSQLRREFVWVASGRALLTQKSPKLKALAEKGLMFKGSHFRIP